MSDKEMKSYTLNRRSVLKASALGVGALVAAKASVVAAADTEGSVDHASAISIPDEIPASLALPASPGAFENGGMTGAQVFAKACKNENLAVMFCCPGNYEIINAMATEGIPCYGGRTEGAMCSAADGFSRATGEVVAVSGTEGPGFTNMIMNIAAANAARTPLLVLASNMVIAGEDRELLIQNVYQQPTTEGMKKYGKRIIEPNRVHEYAAYAFRNLKSGVPAPVHLDFPGEVSKAVHKDPSELTDFYQSSHYRTESRAYPSPADIKSAIALIAKAERPIIVAGQGVFQRKAWDALEKVVNLNEIAMVESGPSRGHVADDHRLQANTASTALMSADLVILVGQYCMPSRNEFAFSPNAKAIRVHPEQEDLGRNWPIDLGIVSDERYFLEELADRLPGKKRPQWVEELAAARQAYDQYNTKVYQAGLKYSDKTGYLHPAVIGQGIEQFFYQGEIDPRQTVTTVGGYTSGRFVRCWTASYRPGQSLCSPYQYGAIGPDIAMALGTGAAVQRGVGPQAPYQGAPVVCVTSDGGAAYSLFEMDTASKYKIPMIVIIYNNNAWGVFGAAAHHQQAMHMYLFQENLRYDKIAEGLGVRGEYVQTPDQFNQALARSYRHASTEGLSTVINCQGIKEFTTPAQYPPGPPMRVEPGRTSVTH